MATGIAPVTCPDGPKTDVVRLQLRDHNAARHHAGRRPAAHRREKISARHHQEPDCGEEKHMSEVVEM